MDSVDDGDGSDRVLELVMDDKGPASIIMRDGKQSTAESYVVMDEELMKHALPSHEDSGIHDPLEVGTPDKGILKDENPDREEEAVHVDCAHKGCGKICRRYGFWNHFLLSSHPVGTRK